MHTHKEEILKLIEKGNVQEFYHYMDYVGVNPTLNDNIFLKTASKLEQFKIIDILLENNSVYNTVLDINWLNDNITNKFSKNHIENQIRKIKLSNAIQSYDINKLAKLIPVSEDLIKENGYDYIKFAFNYLDQQHSKYKTILLMLLNIKNIDYSQNDMEFIVLASQPLIDKEIILFLLNKEEVIKKITPEWINKYVFDEEKKKIAIDIIFGKKIRSF